MDKKLEHLTSLMDNVDAYKLGIVAKTAGKPDNPNIGDNIDRGLMLRRILEEYGYYLIKKY